MLSHAAEDLGPAGRWGGDFLRDLRAGGFLSAAGSSDQLTVLQAVNP